MSSSGILCNAIAAANRAELPIRDAYGGDDCFETPEAAALSGWPPIARARALSTEYLDDLNARVVVDTEPSHPMTVVCERLELGRVWTHVAGTQLPHCLRRSDILPLRTRSAGRASARPASSSKLSRYLAM